MGVMQWNIGVGIRKQINWRKYLLYMKNTLLESIRGGPPVFN